MRQEKNLLFYHQNVAAWKSQQVNWNWQLLFKQIFLRLQWNSALPLLCKQFLKTICQKLLWTSKIIQHLIPTTSFVSGNLDRWSAMGNLSCLHSYIYHHPQQYLEPPFIQKPLHHGSKSIQALQDQKNLCKEKNIICVRAFHFSKESLCAILTGQLALRNAQGMVLVQMYILGVAERGWGVYFHKL